MLQSWRAALWGVGQLFPFSEFFDNPGQSLIRSAKDLLSWFRIGRYLQCPPRKEPLNTRYATLSTRPSCSQPQTFRQGSRVPQNPSFSSRRWCQLRWETSWSNPLIFQFEEQCRESLSIDETWQDKRASRENKGEDGEEKNATASVECQRRSLHIKNEILIALQYDHYNVLL